PGSGVKEVLIEYNNLNHTMNFIGFDTWQWSNWMPSSTGIFDYAIYMIDNSNNLNTTIGSIEVFQSSGPIIQNLSKSANPLELGQTEIIQVDIDDIDGVSEVFFEIDAINYTMVNIGGVTYEYSWTPTSFGTKFFKIYANDSLNNWNQITNNIFVQDTTPPNFANITESSDPLELGDSIVISIEATDLSYIKQVFLEYDNTNHSMHFIGGNKWLNNTWTPSIVNIYQYRIYIQDNANNWNSTSGSIQVIDTTIPLLSNLNESADLLELGQTEIISIDIIDFATISLANIEINSNNYTMNNLGGTTWQYNWIPNSVGLKYYIIYAKDSNNNLNQIKGNISVFDTSAPILSNLIENSEPLELGNSVAIQVDVFDFSLLNFVLFENDGINYSMTNIGGLTWYFNNWTPNNIGLKFYTIHAADTYNNSISLLNNITVLDTIGPVFSNLLISNKTIMIGQSILIQVDIIDVSNVSEVFIEYEGLNHSMNNIFDHTWEYNWTPSLIGDMSIVIYAKDNHNNWNMITDNIMVNKQLTPMITLKQIVDIAVNISIISIFAVGITIVIRTSRTKRFIK
ncbi:MAG: Ig-like domain repeat protein, partial [Candidatus Hermodarchaeota archaeon]